MVLFFSATEKASRRRLMPTDRLKKHVELGRARSAAAQRAQCWANWEARWWSAGFVAWSFGRLRVASPSQYFGRLREDLPLSEL